MILLVKAIISTSHHVKFWWMIGSRRWLTCHLGTIYPSYVRQATWTDTFEYDKSSCFIPVNHWLLLITISLKPFLFTNTISKGFFPWSTSVKLERVTWRIMMVFCLCRAGVCMACTWHIWPKAISLTPLPWPIYSYMVLRLPTPLTKSLCALQPKAFSNWHESHFWHNLD